MYNLELAIHPAKETEVLRTHVFGFDLIYLFTCVSNLWLGWISLHTKIVIKYWIAQNNCIAKWFSGPFITEAPHTSRLTGRWWMYSTTASVYTASRRASRTIRYYYFRNRIASPPPPALLQKWKEQALEISLELTERVPSHFDVLTQSQRRNVQHWIDERQEANIHIFFSKERSNS